MSVRALEIGGRAFYLRDGLMEVWLAVIVDKLAEESHPPAWKGRLARDLREQSTLVFDGLVSASLDAHLTTPERLEEFVRICHEVRTALASDDFRAGPTARVLGSGRWNDDMGRRLTRVTDAVLWLAAQDA